MIGFTGCGFLDGLGFCMDKGRDWNGLCQGRVGIFIEAAIDNITGIPVLKY